MESLRRAEPRWSVRGALAVLCVATLLGSGCTPSSDDDDDVLVDSDGSTPLLDCEVDGYPCALSDVPSEILENTSVLAHDALSMFEEGASTSDAASWLRRQAGVVEATHDDEVIRFRLDGGRAAWIFRDSETEPSRGGSSPGVSPSVKSRAPVSRFFDVVEGTSATESDRGPGDLSALILSPWRHEWGPLGLDEGRAVTDILSRTKGYEGRVDYFENLFRFDTTVSVASFKGWEDYQVVHVATHGWSLCDPVNPGPCKGALLSHLVEGGFAGDGRIISLEEWTQTVREIEDVGVDLGWSETSPGRGLELEPEGSTAVLITADFFRDVYRGGLKSSTVVFLNGCRMIGTAPSTDLVEALRGDNSLVIGWDTVVIEPAAHDAAVQFYTDMSEGGYTVNHGLELLGSMRTDRFGSQLISSGRRSGGDLRIRHVVTALDPDTNCPLDEGTFYVPIEGTAFDGLNDSVGYKVRVDGIPPPDAPDAVLKVFVMPQYVLEAYLQEGVPLPAIESAIDPVPISDGEPVGQDSWILDGTVPIGEDATTGLYMWAWVDLPEGGKSFTEAPFLVDDPEVDEYAYTDRPTCASPSEDLLTSSGFKILEQRFNYLVQVRQGASEGSSSSEVMKDLYVVSFDADETQQSTETRDGTVSPIAPLGFGGYVDTLSEGAGSATALLGMEFFTTTPTSSEIAMSGDFVRALTGSSTGEGDPDNLSLAYASAGILFTFTGDPLDVKMVWDCGLEVKLETIDDERQTIFYNRWDPPVTLEAPLTDGHTVSRDKITRQCEQIVPSFEGTLQPDTVYQLVLDFGYFADRYANEGKVWVQGEVLDETGNYDVHETNTFALILTAAG